MEKLSRFELDNKIMPMVMASNQEELKHVMIDRYKTDRFSRLTNEQLADFYEFLLKRFADG
jgi:hypothetical protein